MADASERRRSVVGDIDLRLPSGAWRRLRLRSAAAGPALGLAKPGDRVAGIVRGGRCGRGGRFGRRARARARPRARGGSWPDRGGRGRLGGRRGRRRGRCRSRRCGPAAATSPMTAASLSAATSPRSIAARADEPAARSRAASIPATSTGRGATAARRRQPPASQRRASASSRRPIDTRRSAMSSGQRRSARIEQCRPEVGVRVGRLEVVGPGLDRRLDRAPAGRRPERGEERLVRPEQAVLGGGRRDEAERPPERRRAGPRLRHPDDVRPGIDLAE